MRDDRQFADTCWQNMPAKMSNQEILAMLDSLDAKPWSKEHRWRWRTVIVIVAAISLLILFSTKKGEYPVESVEKNNIMTLNANSLPPVSLFHEIAQANAQVELDTRKNTVEPTHTEAVECTKKPRKHAVPNYVRADKLIKFIGESNKLSSSSPASPEPGTAPSGKADRDIVVRSAGQSTETLVKRCRALGFLEGELCRIRICSGLWGVDPACPNSNNRASDRF